MSHQPLVSEGDPHLTAAYLWRYDECVTSSDVGGNSVHSTSRVIRDYDADSEEASGGGVPEGGLRDTQRSSRQRLMEGRMS